MVKPEAGSDCYDSSYFLNEDGSYGGIESNDSDKTAVCLGWNGIFVHKHYVANIQQVRQQNTPSSSPTS